MIQKKTEKLSSRYLNESEVKATAAETESALVDLLYRVVSLPAKLESQERVLEELKSDTEQCRRGLQSVARQLHEADSSLTTLAEESRNAHIDSGRHDECIEEGISRLEKSMSSHFFREQVVRPMAMQLLVAVDMIDDLLEHGAVDQDVHLGLRTVFLQTLNGYGIYEITKQPGDFFDGKTCRPTRVDHDGEKEMDGKITKVQRSGYCWQADDEIFRPVSVVVCRCA